MEQEPKLPLLPSNSLGSRDKPIHLSELQNGVAVGPPGPSSSDIHLFNKSSFSTCSVPMPWGESREQDRQTRSLSSWSFHLDVGVGWRSGKTSGQRIHPREGHV